MPKAAQLATNAHVELAWYFASMVQVRVRGRAWTFPSGGEVPPPPGEGQGEARAQWTALRDDLFTAGVSPYLRATFARPGVPGSRLADAPDSGLWPVKLGVEEVS
jgi:hypothetical protein